MHGQYVAATHNKLTRAIAIHANGRARTGSHFHRAKLLMVTGDLLEAVVLGTQALDWVSMVRTRRPRSHTAAAVRVTAAVPAPPTVQEHGGAGVPDPAGHPVQREQQRDHAGRGQNDHQAP
jgi:hypothetical protein